MALARAADAAARVSRRPASGGHSASRSSPCGRVAGRWSGQSATIADAQLGCPQAVAIADQDHGRVPMAVTARLPGVPGGVPPSPHLVHRPRPSAKGRGLPFRGRRYADRSNLRTSRYASINVARSWSQRPVLEAEPITRYSWATVRFATSWNSGRSRNDHDVSPAAAATLDSVARRRSEAARVHQRLLARGGRVAARGAQQDCLPGSSYALAFFDLDLLLLLRDLRWLW